MKVNAEIFLVFTLADDDVGGDAHDQFVQYQPVRPKRDQFLRAQAGFPRELGYLGEIREYVCRVVNRLQLAVLHRNLGFDTRIPRGILRVIHLRFPRRAGGASTQAGRRPAACAGICCCCFVMVVSCVPSRVIIHRVGKSGEQ